RPLAWSGDLNVLATRTFRVLGLLAAHDMDASRNEVALALSGSTGGRALPTARRGGSSMSYFLFGEFVFGRRLDHDELADFAFATVSLATSRRLGLQMGHAVVQHIIFEMLGTRRDSEFTAALPYLITDSPTSDNSDLLVSPVALVGEDGQDLAQISRNLVTTGEFLKDALRAEALASLKVFVSDGFNDAFDELNTSIDEFQAAVTRWYASTDDPGALRVIVTRSEAL